MARRETSVVIEQLFEDYNRISVYEQGSSPVAPKHLPLNNKIQILRSSSKSIRPHRSITKDEISRGNANAVNELQNFNKVKTPNVPSFTTIPNKDKTLSTPSSPKSKSAEQDVITPIDESNVKFPITYDLALSLYGSKLSLYERSEIVNYDPIYYLGLNANKIQESKNGSSNSYDDDEKYYRVVPHDHIAYRYEIIDKPTLGSGTFAQVIKAFDHRYKKTVAIKIVRNARVYLQQSREELRILQLLKKQDSAHKFHLVHIYEFFMFRNHMCISFELLGMNLYQVIKKNNYKGLGAKKIMQVARCTLNCLELLYKSRIIHCDIKPENILLKRNGDFTSVKVADFGSSCYEQQQLYHYIQSRYYRSPEVILGMRYGPAIDMWSLGCVLGELSVGQPTFVGRSEMDQLAAIEEVMGSLPDSLKIKAKNKVTNTNSPSRVPGSKSFGSVVHGDDMFKDFVRQMLQWDPHVRPTPMEILEHPWIKKVPMGRVSTTSQTRGSSSARTSIISNKASV